MLNRSVAPGFLYFLCLGLYFPCGVLSIFHLLLKTQSPPHSTLSLSGWPLWTDQWVPWAFHVGLMDGECQQEIGGVRIVMLRYLLPQPPPVVLFPGCALDQRSIRRSSSHSPLCHWVLVTFSPIALSGLRVASQLTIISPRIGHCPLWFISGFCYYNNSRTDFSTLCLPFKSILHSATKTMI